MDNRVRNHPRVAWMSDGQFGRWVTVLCHCAAMDTDGLITVPVLKRLGIKQPEVKLLVGVGLLEATSDADVYHVHDWNDYTRPVDLTGADRARRYRERQKLRAV